MKKNNFLALLQIVFILLLVINLSAQSVDPNDVYSYEQKKQKVDSPSRSFRGLNSPTHSFDVLKYTMNINLLDNFDEPYPQNYEADIMLQFRVDSTLNNIKLDAVNSSLQINSVGMAGTSFIHQNDTLSIALDQIYQPGDIVIISIDYQHLDVEDGAFRATYEFVFTDSKPEGARKWFPCYDKPSDKAALEIYATVPIDVLLGSNGALVDSTFSDNQITYHWRSTSPISTYLMVITARKNYNLDIFYWERPSDSVKIPFRFYYNSGQDPTAIEAVAFDMCDHFSKSFGEYPFEKSGFASLFLEFQWYVLENQTLICPRFWSESHVSKGFAQQWFGGMISPGTWADAWLSEGFGTWGEAHWLELSDDYGAYKEELNSNALNYLNNNPGWAIYNPDWAFNTPPNNMLFHPVISNNKSSCIIHQFRYIVGDSLFFKAIKAFATDTINFKFKTFITQDFVDKMSEEVGEDMHWYFDPWLEQFDHPIYENKYYFTDEGDGKWKVHFIAKQVQGEPRFFPMELSIFIYFNDLSDTTFRFRNMENNEEFVFDIEKEPFTMLFDVGDNILLKEASLTVSTNELYGPEVSVLFNNIPNPAQNQTIVNYSISQSGWINLELYDLSGNKVKILFAGQQKLGKHQVVVETASLKAGIYLYSLRTDDKTFVNKMVVAH